VNYLAVLVAAWVGFVVGFFTAALFRIGGER
jgi:hypothetical protein